MHEVIWAGIDRVPKDASAKGKLVLNRSVLGLGSIVDHIGARLLTNRKDFNILGCQISACFED